MLKVLDIYICEDDTKQLKTLTNIIQKDITINSYDMKIVSSTPNPSELVNLVKLSNSTGIYFLDISLNADIDGFELSNIIREYDPRGFIIFITADANKYKLTFSYNCEAMDYIVKGSKAELEKRIENCLDKINKRFSAKNIIKSKVFAFKSGDSISYEEFQNIVSIETSTTNKHKLSIYSTERIMEFRASLKEISSVLDDRFAKVSSSCIVNMDMINIVYRKKRIIVLKSGREVLISIRCIKNFEQSMAKRNLSSRISKTL